MPVMVGRNSGGQGCPLPLPATTLAMVLSPLLKSGRGMVLGEVLTRTRFQSEAVFAAASPPRRNQHDRLAKTRRREVSALMTRHPEQFQRGTDGQPYDPDEPLVLRWADLIAARNAAQALLVVLKDPEVDLDATRLDGMSDPVV